MPVRERSLPVGQRGGSPSASQRAAATAANTASEPLTGGRSPSAPTTTVTGGMSRAGRIPNDRMVRSWTTPAGVHGDALAPHPAQSLVGGAQGVGPEHHLVEHLARLHHHLDRAVGPTAGRGPAPGRAGHPDRRVDDPPAVGAPRHPGAGGQDGGLGPHRGPQVGGDGGTVERHRFEDQTGGHRRHVGHRPGPPVPGQPVEGDGDPEDTGPVGVDPGGHRWSFGSAAHHVLARPDDPHRATVGVGQPAGVGGHR